ncbi:MAG: hypothetical protein ACRDVZ_00710, partial [Jiangellaceae bacterium]
MMIVEVLPRNVAAASVPIPRAMTVAPVRRYQRSTHLQVRAQLGEGEDLLDERELTTVGVVLVADVGVHDQQVHQPSRESPR